MIEVIKEQPPFLLQLQMAGMKPERTTIYPFGNRIFNPSGEPIPPDIWIHEVCHIAQQGKNPKSWWDKYILDKNFRFKQELEANREQYKFFCKAKKDKNEQMRALIAIAKNMAGEVYNLNVKTSELMELIKQ